MLELEFSRILKAFVKPWKQRIGFRSSLCQNFRLLGNTTCQLQRKLKFRQILLILTERESVTKNYDKILKTFVKATTTTRKLTWVINFLGFSLFYGIRKVKNVSKYSILLERIFCKPRSTLDLPEHRNRFRSSLCRNIWGFELIQKCLEESECLEVATADI